MTVKAKEELLFFYDMTLFLMIILFAGQHCHSILNVHVALLQEAEQYTILAFLSHAIVRV